MEIRGKKVLVTGGAIRVGAQICRVFAEEGAELVIHYLHSLEEARKLCAELGGERAGHSVYCCDLVDLEATRKMIRDTVPDILINNASTYVRRSFSEETVPEFSAQIAVNFYAPVEMIRELAACAAGEVAVVNILDQAIVKTDRDSFSYSLSKKMLAEATRSAALEYAPGIRVNAVAPGPVIAPKGLEHFGMKKTLQTVPLERPVDARDLAKAILFLASNNSITGEILFVDCGQHLNKI